MSKNYDWYVKADISRFAGKWIAIVDQKPVASGIDAKKVYEEAKRNFLIKNPLLPRFQHQIH